MITPTFGSPSRFLDASHTAFIWYALWSYFINDYGAVAIIDDIHWYDLPFPHRQKILNLWWILRRSPAVRP